MMVPKTAKMACPGKHPALESEIKQIFQVRTRGAVGSSAPGFGSFKFFIKVRTGNTRIGKSPPPEVVQLRGSRVFINI